MVSRGSTAASIHPPSLLGSWWGRHRSKEVEERLQAAVASARAAAKASHTGKMVSPGRGAGCEPAVSQSTIECQVFTDASPRSSKQVNEQL